MRRSLASVLVAVFATAAAQTPPPPTPPTIDELRSLPYAAPGKPAEGKTGVITNSRFAQPGYNFYGDRFNNRATLLTNDGATLHTWSRPNSSSWGHVELLPSGELLVIECWDALKKDRYPNEKGFESRIVKLAPDSRVEWTSHIPAHHDIQVLADGFFLTLTERRRQIDAVDKTHVTVDNGIALLAGNGSLMKEKSLYQILERSRKVTLKNVKPDERGLVDLFHTNSIQRFSESKSLPPGPMYDRNNILFCSRHQDLIGIISEKGRLLWSWGQKELSGPHSARLLPNGDILVFDNGLGRKASRIVEVDPRTDRIVWTYQPERAEDFYSATGGYCQHLPNGNVLVTDSWQYSAFEVTPERRVVWRFVSPEKSFVYRMDRYAFDFFTPRFRQSWPSVPPR